MGDVVQRLFKRVVFEGREVSVFLPFSAAFTAFTDLETDISDLGWNVSTYHKAPPSP